MRARWSSFVLVLSLARPVLAAPEDTSTAEALFQSAKEALARGDLTTACARFAESVRLDPAAGGFLNLADCEERSGKLASALAHFQEARDRLRPDDYRMAFVSERLARLGPRVPHLTIRVHGPPAGDATTLRDDIALGTASLGVPLPVEPGPHVIVLHVPGHADTRREVSVREGESLTIDVLPGPAIPGGAVPPAGSAGKESPPSTGSTQRTLGIVLGGAGLAMVAAGSVLGVVSKSTYDGARSHCPNGPSSCTTDGVNGGQTAYDEATASTVVFVAAGICLAAGVTLYLTAPRAARTVALLPAAGTHEAGMDVVGTW